MDKGEHASSINKKHKIKKKGGDNPALWDYLSVWPYALWKNICFALEDAVLWMLKP